MTMRRNWADANLTFCQLIICGSGSRRIAIKPVLLNIVTVIHIDETATHDAVIIQPNSGLSVAE